MRKEIKCQHCGHTWTTKSKMLFVSCPNCLKKTKTYKSTTILQGSGTVKEIREKGLVGTTKRKEIQIKGDGE